ncbi:cytochrome c oxidase assembly factor Coa1 family protein [Flavobacterium soli]|uniref:cytochrome c oxidase assembly factor Coa1 family protein n=1 Tax=Flavobacterium soli TaxID=344881 RepID=UPI00040728A7|nr:cytochrome c oxidase assembly factor Coa1 family protein [Flavobacterium soli]
MNIKESESSLFLVINYTIMNELIREKSWGVRNWKWLVPITALLIMIIAFLSLTSGLMSFAQAYAEPALYENALEKARQNERVSEVLGTIQPVDKLTILEGNVVYAEDHNAVNLTFRVTGSKGKGKMDIQANKIDGNWEYELIKIRIKKPEEEIIVLGNE